MKNASTKKASLLSQLEPGQIVHHMDGSAYRVASKFAGPDGFVFKLANLQGKPVPTPVDFRPVSLAMARFASWLRYHLAYRQDFDLYIQSYIEKYNHEHPDKPLPIQPIGPDGKPFRWAKWFQSKISPKLHVKQTGPAADEMKDEAIHEMMFTELGQRDAIGKFYDKIKNFGDVQQMELGRQLTVYLTRVFEYRVSEMQKKLKAIDPTMGFELEEHLEDLMSELKGAKTKKQRDSVMQRIEETKAQLADLGEYKDAPRSVSMIQPTMEEGDEGGEQNILEQEQYGVGEEDFTTAEAKRDIARFRTGFARWLEHTQGKKAPGLILLFDLYWVLVSKSGKGKAREDVDYTQKEQKKQQTENWMVSRGEMQDAWMNKTGLSFGAFKEYLSQLPSLIEQYVESHRNELKDNAVLALMDKIKAERGNARPARVSSLNIAGIEEDIEEARKAVVSPMRVASEVQPEIDQARAAVDSTKSIDPDLNVQTVSAVDAAGVTVPKLGKKKYPVVPVGDGDYEVDYYDFPEHWDKDEQEPAEKHDKTAAQRISGDLLTPEMKKQVLNAFVHRWTKENPYRTKVYKCDKCDVANNPYVNTQSAEGHPHPTIPLISDDQWIKEHSFAFTNDGRLVTRGDDRHAMPAYMGQHHEARVATAEQKFAILKAATTSVQECCGAFTPKHKQDCDVYNKNFDKMVNTLKSMPKKEGMLGHDINDADGQAVRPDITPGDTGRLPHAYKEGRGLLPGGRSKCKECGESPCVCDDDKTAAKIALQVPQGKDDPRGAGDMWREAYYERTEAGPTADSLGLTASVDVLPDWVYEQSGWKMIDGHWTDVNGHGIDPRLIEEAQSYGESGSVLRDVPTGLRFSSDKTAQGAGNTTVTFQEQNVTDPMAPHKGQPEAVAPGIDQTPGPHSPNAPMTAPRTPGIQPRIVDVPAGAGTEMPGSAPASAKYAGAVCPECGGAHTEVDATTDGGYSLYCDDCERTVLDQPGSAPTGVAASAKEADYQPYATYDRLKKHHEDARRRREEVTSEGNCTRCGEALNNAEPPCPRCLAEGAEDRHEAAGAAPVVSPNVQQNLNIARPPVQQQAPGTMVGIMPGQGEEEAPEKKTIEPELPNAKYHMSAQDELIMAEESRLMKAAGMNEFRITFEDGNTVETGFNGTLEDAEAYYLHNDFNFGDVEGPDHLVRGVKVEQLNADPNARVNEYLRDMAARGFDPNPETVRALQGK